MGDNPNNFNLGWGQIYQNRQSWFSQLSDAAVTLNCGHGHHLWMGNDEGILLSCEVWPFSNSVRKMATFNLLSCHRVASLTLIITYSHFLCALKIFFALSPRRANTQFLKWNITFWSFCLFLLWIHYTHASQPNATAELAFTIFGIHMPVNETVH